MYDIPVKRFGVILIEKLSATSINGFSPADLTGFENFKTVFGSQNGFALSEIKTKINSIEVIVVIEAINGPITAFKRYSNQYSIEFFEENGIIFFDNYCLSDKPGPDKLEYRILVVPIGR